MKENRLTASQARERLSDLLSRAAFSGESFTIHRYGKDLARIVPSSPKQKKASVKTEDQTLKGDSQNV